MVQPAFGFWRVIGTVAAADGSAVLVAVTRIEFGFGRVVGALNRSLMSIVPTIIVLPLTQFSKSDRAGAKRKFTGYPKIGIERAGGERFLGNTSTRDVASGPVSIGKAILRR